MAMTSWTGLGQLGTLILDRFWKLASRVFVPLTILLYFLKDFIAGFLVAMLEPIGDALDLLVLNVDIGSINTNLAQVNAFFPIPEFLAMVVGFIGLWAAVQTVKWVLKFIPTLG